MGLYFLKCEISGCRKHAGPAACDVCRTLLCPRHVVWAPGPRPYCPKCANAAQICVEPTQICVEPTQMELFPRVRPRSKRSALDGLQRQ